MAEKAQVDRARDVAWVARTVILQMRNDGARLDGHEIHDAVVAVFAHYHLEPELLERLRTYVSRWVRRCEMQRRAGTVPPPPAHGPPTR
jgi:hypothetical protein